GTPPHSLGCPTTRARARRFGECVRLLGRPARLRVTATVCRPTSGVQPRLTWGPRPSAPTTSPARCRPGSWGAGTLAGAVRAGRILKSPHQGDVPGARGVRLTGATVLEVDHVEVGALRRLVGCVVQPTIPTPVGPVGLVDRLAPTVQDLHAEILQKKPLHLEGVVLAIAVRGEYV